jgi:hypothetical protein
MGYVFTVSSLRATALGKELAMLRVLRAAILIGVIFSGTSAFAASWYVSKGASGSNNGTSWTNAWNEINQINFSTVACGDTIWLAGGSYTTGATINKSCSSGAQLYIRRVLSTDSVPTSAAGWNPSFDSQVLITNGSLSIRGSYWTLDGRVGDAASGVPYGIKMVATSGMTQIGGYGGSSNTMDQVSLIHIEIQGAPCVNTGNCSDNAWPLNLLQDNQNVTNFYLGYYYIHQAQEMIRAKNWTNVVIEHGYLSGDRNDGLGHEDVIYASDPNNNVTFRFNRVWDSPNDGIWWDNGAVNNLYFYDNIIYHVGGWAMGFPRCTTACGPMYIYNNIFENDGTYGDYQPGFIGGNSGSQLKAGTEWANNIFYEIGINTFPSSQFDYNAFDQNVSMSCAGCFSFAPGSPLNKFSGWTNMNSSNPIMADFHLTSAGAALFAGKGKNLGPPFNVDFDGNPRPSSGAWTIGPYEYQTTSSGPQPPTGLVVTVQ